MQAMGLVEDSLPVLWLLPAGKLESLMRLLEQCKWLAGSSSKKLVL